MDFCGFYLFALLCTSICILSDSLKLPGPGDWIAITKILNLPYSPYFFPEIPLLIAPKRTKLFGLPPLFINPI
ncbi:unnamed protein product, partial [Onchocerca ochengi]|uniref:Secreted protein n=1 Tax=Onchocerca ochengi TaxID=42157 RepID=A0A182EZ84_ONCOC